MTFWWIAAATLASEDLACFAAGLLVARGEMSFGEAVTACAGGIFVGDLALYGVGRSSEWLLRRFAIPEAKIARARAWLESRGQMAIFLSRFTPGLRLPTYVVAGLLKLPVVPFAATLLLAVVCWSVLIVGAIALLGHAPAWWSLAGPVAALVVLQSSSRWKRWEFWPAWAAYLPLVPYWLALAIRHRSLTVFTLANPGILTGGLAGESKSETLEHLRRGAPGHVPEFEIVETAEEVERGFEYPVVLKPDVGERGEGVVIARDRGQVEAYLSGKRSKILAQRYIEGAEFGLMYSEGRVTSITAKSFPQVTGDGQRTIEELIDADPRAEGIKETYRLVGCANFRAIPGVGERVDLVEIGSHCRGTMFLDGRSLWSPELESAVAVLAAAHPGFYLGRFDVRAASSAALREGRFQVLELNGVGGEPSHIYDPGVSLIEAYRTLAAHWRTAFAIGAANRARGLRPMSLWRLVKILRTRC